MHVCNQSANNKEYLYKRFRQISADGPTYGTYILDMTLAVTLVTAANVRSLVLHNQSAVHACEHMTTPGVKAVALSIHTYHTGKVVALFLVRTGTPRLVYRVLDGVVIVTRTVARRKISVRITALVTAARRVRKVSETLVESSDQIDIVFRRRRTVFHHRGIGG